MDLISRAWLKEAIHNFFNGLTHVVTEEDIQRYIDVAPSAFEGMTNGEVMQAVYTDSEIEINETQNTVTVYLGADGDYCEDEVRFDLDWWNAPYKAESEEIC